MARGDSGDSVVDEAALKWSDLAHVSSGGRVDQRCADSGAEPQRAGLLALQPAKNRLALPSLRTTASLNAALVTIHTHFGGP